MSNSVNLRVQSDRSFKSGLATPEELVLKAVADGQEALALTDRDGMFGAIEFYKAARDHGVKPIMGVDVLVEPDITRPGTDFAPVRLLLLARGEAGYRNIMSLVSRSGVENLRLVDKERRPSVRQSWLEELSASGGLEGVVALCGGEGFDMSAAEFAKKKKIPKGVKVDPSALLNSSIEHAWGEIPLALIEGVNDPDPLARANDALSHYRRWFGDGGFFLEIQRAGFENQDQLCEGLVRLSESSGVPLVATNPVQFVEPEDYYIHEIKYCIGAKQKLNEFGRRSPFTRDQNFKTDAEMRALFSDIPQVVDNALLLSRTLGNEITLGKYHLPKYDVPEGMTEDQEFERQAREGLEKRLEVAFPDPAVRAERRGEYDDRLTYELDVISRMGFAGYYLIVGDFIQWSIDHDVPVGPGRGSGAGSLAAWSMDITNIDPIRHGLLFERFLNPERVSMPDFDIDFANAGRDLVIEYVSQKYGADRVSAISTIGTMAARASLNDAARVLGIPYGAVKKLTDAIPKVLDITLKDAFEQSEEFRALVTGTDLNKELYGAATALEGRARSVGKHAAGILISPDPTSGHSPLYVDDANEPPLSQYTKDDVEKVGMVKFDFLGLITLDAIKEASALINARPENAGKPLNLNALEFDDPEVFKMFARGDTKGVFQFESAGMRKYLAQLAPSKFGDIVAMNALYRPGPMSLIPQFINRAHGREEVSYAAPVLEEVLGETYGIAVYQEQVMKIAQVMAGYSLGGADLLRRAMGKKKPEEMAKQRAKFIKGAAKHGHSEQTANEVFDYMEKFAGYGFNKSHSAAYSMLAYQSAWLKTHYPAEFYASAINQARDDKAVKVLVDDAKVHGIQILPPDVNLSMAGTSVADDRSIRLGFSAIKGLGHAATAIVRMREQVGGFSSVADYCEKSVSLGNGAANKRILSVLTTSGSFDSLGNRRDDLFESLPVFVKYASDLSKRKAKIAAQESMVPDVVPAQGDLLAGVEGDGKPTPRRAKKAKPKASELPPPPAPEIAPAAEPWDLLGLLAREHASLGFYMTDSPYTAYKAQFDGLDATVKMGDLDGNSVGTYPFVAGAILKVDKNVTKKGDEMARIVIDDGTGEMEVTVFPQVWAANKSWIKPGEFVSVDAKVEDDDYNAVEGEDPPMKLLGNQLFNLETTRTMLTDRVNVVLRRPRLGELKEILDQHPPVSEAQSWPVTVFMPAEGENDEYYRAELKQGIACSPEAVAALVEKFGEPCVKRSFVPSFKVPKPERSYGGNRHGRSYAKGSQARP